MEIPNLSNQPIINQPTKSLKIPGKSDYIYYSLIIVAAIIVGFGISRFLPSQSSDSVSQGDSLSTNQAAQVVEGEDLKVGVLYGNTSQIFSDSAIGTVKSGGVNGEGTHTLDRQGGVDQDAALTSSIIDLDLFVGKEVEVNGETNTSNKAGWFMDVGSIKIIE